MVTLATMAATVCLCPVSERLLSAGCRLLAPVQADQSTSFEPDAAAGRTLRGHRPCDPAVATVQAYVGGSGTRTRRGCSSTSSRSPRAGSTPITSSASCAGSWRACGCRAVSSGGQDLRISGRASNAQYRAAAQREREGLNDWAPASAAVCGRCRCRRREQRSAVRELSDTLAIDRTRPGSGSAQAIDNTLRRLRPAPVSTMPS